eukprot:CAMPEP_0116871630 /NCGR_PEP_ID=MMETSP0463-20121206/2079_1 /TAXON_ID=181622 /ORGANISM="Strombidinopsis sp, Strain SopsisLIS2011" /LENGTH=54 /DNA_ID=CAMNT_0004510441 /DNA_START=1191 /DNA_END=1355 /DNA_ORIENTATION=+
MKIIDPWSKKLVLKETVMEFFEKTDFLDAGRGVADEEEIPEADIEDEEDLTEHL